MVAWLIKLGNLKLNQPNLTQSTNKLNVSFTKR